MEVKDFQKKIVDFANKWDKKRNNIPDTESTLIHLMEEVGELSRQYINKRMRKEKFDEEEVKNAIGDALMQLVKIAHLEGLNIENVVTEIIEDEPAGGFWILKRQASYTGSFEVKSQLNSIHNGLRRLKIDSRD